LLQLKPFRAFPAFDVAVAVVFPHMVAGLLIYLPENDNDGNSQDKEDKFDQ
jgi:hypothetical protein